MNKDITDYVSKCVTCLANAFKQSPEPMRMFKLQEYKWNQVGIGFYGPLPSDEFFVLF